MPTAVDYTNILVNYLEVSTDDVPATQSTVSTSTPIDIQPAKGETVASSGVYPPFRDSHGPAPPADSAKGPGMRPQPASTEDVATSSSRRGVWATRATTTYKNKHVTTVLYKPTNEENES